MILELNTENQEKEMLEGQRRYREMMASAYKAGYTDAKEIYTSIKNSRNAIITDLDTIIADQKTVIAYLTALPNRDNAILKDLEQLIDNVCTLNTEIQTILNDIHTIDNDESICIYDKKEATSAKAAILANKAAAISELKQKTAALKAMINNND